MNTTSKHCLHTLGKGRYVRRKLLGTQSAKTQKGEAVGYLTGILYLAPSDVSGYNVCPFAKACKEGCLNTAGRGAFTSVQLSRIEKTRLFFTDRESFLENLFLDCEALVRKAKRMGLLPCIRLNGTSDISFHRMVIPSQGKTLLELFPDVPFYDYTKNLSKALENASGKHPKNYTVVFSRDSIANEKWCNIALSSGVNVAVVFREKIPQTFWGIKVLNGDETDLRFLDAKAKEGESGFIIGLKAKGKAKKDLSGFVVDLN